MFEKRVRQVADTVKRMAMDIPRDSEDNVTLSLEECKRMMAEDAAEGTVNPGLEQTRQEDRLLFAELQNLVNEGRACMSSAPSTPASDEEPAWTIRQQVNWNGRCDVGVEDAFRTPEPSFNDDAPGRWQFQDGLSWNDLIPEQMD